jgi:hypothetical protein
MRLGASFFISASILAASVAMLPASAQSGDLVALGGHLEAAAFIDDSQRVRQDATTKNDQQAPPLFGMETEPVAGELAAKWRAVEADIDGEQQVLEDCRAQKARRVVAQNLLDFVAEGAGRSGVARVGLINRAVDLAISHDAGADDSALTLAGTMEVAAAGGQRRLKGCARDLPHGFHHIRHYGLLASGTRAHNIARARRLLDASADARPEMFSREGLGR